MSVFFVILLDQVTKFFISRNLQPGSSVEVIENIFYLTLVRNSGTAFGLFKNQTIFFILISIIAAISIIVYIGKKTRASLLTDIALALILAGALGNLIDRLRFGYVIDFLDFRIWPVFNIADSAITLGAFLLILRCIPSFSK